MPATCGFLPQESEAPPAGPQALKPPFDAHYVAVQRGEYQCVDGVRNGLVPDYDELIVKEAQQALPAFRLYFTNPSLAALSID